MPKPGEALRCSAIDTPSMGSFSLELDLPDQGVSDGVPPASIRLIRFFHCMQGNDLGLDFIRCENSSSYVSEGGSSVSRSRGLKELLRRGFRRATCRLPRRIPTRYALNCRVLLERAHHEAAQLLVAAVADHVARRDVAEQRILGLEP